MIGLMNIEKFWELEHIGILPSELQKREICEEGFLPEFLESVTFADGRYSTILNIDSSKRDFLADNYQMARKQFEGLMKLFGQKPSLGAEYVKQIEVFFDNQFAEPLPKGEKPKYLMPHFPVVQESKTSYKVRPVFNASSRRKGQLSLNDIILDVPNLLPTSVEVLLKFRLHNVGLVGDITKAYMTVGIDEKYRNYLCFLWSASRRMEDAKVYRMNRNCFGVKDAQFNVIAVIRHHAAKFSASDSEAAKSISEDLYMDDLITGCASVLAA